MGIDCSYSIPRICPVHHQKSESDQERFEEVIGRPEPKGNGSRDMTYMMYLSRLVFRKACHDSKEIRRRLYPMI